MIGGLLLYQHILITLALFIFIVNQANVLYDTFHIALIRRRVVKKMKESLPMSIDTSARKQIDWQWPQLDFNWWMIPIGVAILLAISAMLYIFFGYDPNPK